jgi:hypothetical protein
MFALAQAPSILVYKGPDCSCCLRWVRHLEAAGYVVAVEERSDLQDVRKRLGVPADLAACHTAQIEGYLIEGHAPAAAIQRLIRERPDAIGVAIPGMPSGSPGMGGTTERYTVMLFGDVGPLSYVQSYAQFLGTDVAP